MARLVLLGGRVLSSLASSSIKARATRNGGPRVSGLRTERSIALIRLTLVGVVAVIYLGSIGVRRSIGPLAVGILVLAALYSLWTLLAYAGEAQAGLRVLIATLLVDVGLVTLWCLATGGPKSEFWTLYLIVVISVAMRSGLKETLGVSFGLAVMYLVIMSTQGGLPSHKLIERPALLMLTGFAAGVIAHQRTIHGRERLAVEALAEEHARALDHERAEADRLRRMDSARAEFVAVAAHEFRGPLAAIIGALSTLRTHGNAIDTELREELLDGANTQAQRLARLVDDLLTISRIEEGGLRLNLELVEPRHLIAEAAQASGTAGVLSVELHRVDPVTCDADAVIRVLTNLLDNARKYSPEGERIVLSVSQDDSVVRFGVRDHGPGVPAEERASVFERFRRLNGSDKPGAGLGLYISRGLVQAHGGSIRVDDASGGGAEFSFTLPRRPGGAAERDGVPTASAIVT